VVLLAVADRRTTWTVVDLSFSSLCFFFCSVLLYFCFFYVSYSPHFCLLLLLSSFVSNGGCCCWRSDDGSSLRWQAVFAAVFPVYVEVQASSSSQVLQQGEEDGERLTMALLVAKERKNNGGSPFFLLSSSIIFSLVPLFFDLLSSIFKQFFLLSLLLLLLSSFAIHPQHLCFQLKKNTTLFCFLLCFFPFFPYVSISLFSPKNPSVFQLSISPYFGAPSSGIYRHRRRGPPYPCHDAE